MASVRLLLLNEYLVGTDMTIKSYVQHPSANLIRCTQIHHDRFRTDADLGILVIEIALLLFVRVKLCFIVTSTLNIRTFSMMLVLQYIAFNTPDFFHIF